MLVMFDGVLLDSDGYPDGDNVCLCATAADEVLSVTAMKVGETLYTAVSNNLHRIYTQESILSVVDRINAALEGVKIDPLTNGEKPS